MKKITLALFGLILTCSAVAQTYTTGSILLLDNDEILYSAQIDINNTLVTLTLSGPDTRYLGLGFGAQSKTSGGDVVMWLNAGEFKLTDRSFGAEGQPPGEDAPNIIPTLDASQDWTIVSNELNSAQRTIVATRLANTGDPKDYVFSTSDTFIQLVWAIGFSYNLSYHGVNRGITSEPITLSQDEFAVNDFKIMQNPSRSKLTLSFPRYSNSLKLDVYDVLGKKILTKQMDGLTSSVDVSRWNNGLYLVRVTSDKGTQTKRFIKQ